MNRTYKKTISKEGQIRKTHRIIVNLLKAEHPALYRELLVKADSLVQVDNNDPLTKISTFGVNAVKTPSEKLKNALYDAHLKRQAEIERRLSAPRLEIQEVDHSK